MCIIIISCKPSRLVGSSTDVPFGRDCTGCICRWLLLCQNRCEWTILLFVRQLGRNCFENTCCHHLFHVFEHPIAKTIDWLSQHFIWCFATNQNRHTCKILCDEKSGQNFKVAHFCDKSKNSRFFLKRLLVQKLLTIS